MERSPEIRHDAASVDRPASRKVDPSRVACRLGDMAVRAASSTPSRDSTEDWAGVPGRTTSPDKLRNLGRLAAREIAPQRDRSR